MADQVPFLNEYKLVFFWKRFIQTLLGGPKFKLGNDRSKPPAYVYINQVLLFILPFILGGLFTLLVELDAIPWYIGTYVFGALMVLYVLSAQCISLFAQKRAKSDVSRIGNFANVLAEEDEVEFDSCFDSETFKFIVPIKKWKINVLVHALISGSMCGLGLWFLLPSTLHLLFSNVGATIIIFVFGWFALCVAQYPLTATGPTEPATYRTTDAYELMPLLRPFYCLVFFSVHLAWRFHTAELLVSNQILHVVFIFLPLLWLLGVLPPLDALWVWMGEQILVKALGGSYMASDIRLLLMLLTSGLTLLVAYFLPSTLSVAIFCACMGYILSLDLSTLCNQILYMCQRNMQKKKVRTINNSESLVQSHLASHTGLGWTWGWKECLLHLIMLLVVGAISGVCSHVSNDINNATNDGLGYTLIGLLVVGELLKLSQSVYIFGIFKNPLFPCNVQTTDVFSRRKRMLHRIGFLWRGLSNIVVPFLMVPYVSLFNTTSTLPSFLYTFGSVRAWRRIWQNTNRSLIEISVVHIINAAEIGPTSWTSSSLGLQLMFVGFLWDRIVQFLEKLHSQIVIMITSYTVEKQRRSSTLPMIIILLVSYPFTLVVLILAAVLSAPILPLFTLPIVMIGFPRAMRFWPEPVGASANKCEDSVYYEQLVPKLTVALRRAIADGSLGTIQPGLFYLIRFQDRMAWLQLLETGYGFCTISIKGMELQETSCHTVEATELDGIFETTFEYERKFKCCTVNKYPLHTLVPVDAFPVQTYSDARNVLTGIIDSPETLQSIDQCFLKTLVWVMLHHNSSRKRGDSTASSPRKGKTVESPERTNSRTGLVSNVPPVRNHTQDSGRPLSIQSAENMEVKKDTVDTKSRTSWEGSLHSWGDDDDDNDSLDLDFSTNKKTAVNLNTRTSANQSANRTSANQSANRTIGSSKGVSALPGTIPDSDEEIDDLIDDLDFGFPAMDNDLKKQAIQNNIPMNTFHKPVIGIKLAGSMQFSSFHSSKLSLPFKWREIPLEPGKVNPHLNKFPKDWYLHVLKKLDLAQGPSEQIAAQIADDDALTNMYSYLVLACYVVVNVTNRTEGQPLTPNHVFKVYSGEIPWSTSLEWLEEDPELMNLVIKAFRLAFKLAYDQAVLGEASDLDELSEYLEEYESDWYFGSEKDTEWAEAVKEERPNLFSLIHDSDEGVYKGRVMTKQPVMTYIGKLNAEVVRSLWASLSLELLYFTNDDEERYSIQAHPVILRNLTIQAAEPPLGYPIYSSPPISIPTF